MSRLLVVEDQKKLLSSLDRQYRATLEAGDQGPT